MAQNEGSVSSALFWMVLLSILLIWLPGIGPFVAGFVGGKKAGGLKNALLAFLVPAALFTIAIILLPGAPFLTLMISIAAFPMLVIYNGMLFVGAIIGGLVS